MISQEMGGIELPLMALVLGIGSIVLIPVAVVVSLWVEVMGLVSVLRLVIVPVALAAVIVGTIARRDIAGKGGQGSREWKLATYGMVAGASTIVLVLAVIILVAVALTALLPLKM